MRQNRCAHPGGAPPTRRLTARWGTVARSLAYRDTEQQVRGARNTDQRLKRLTLSVYDAHTHAHAHECLHIYEP